MKHTLPIKIDKGAGDPIVLIHGLGNNHKSWTYVLKKINYKKNRIVSFDLLGFGDAVKPDDCDYAVSDHANAVITTLDELSIRNATIAGHSMGSLVAIEVVKRRPDLAKNLVLLGAPLFKRMPSKFRSFIFWRKEDVYTKIFRILASKKDMTLEAARAVSKFMPLIKGMEITHETWPAFKKSLNNTIMQTQSYKNLVKLTTPTHLVYGYLDIFVIKKYLKSAARKNRQYVTEETMLGPHEITPIHGKQIAELLQDR